MLLSSYLQRYSHVGIDASLSHLRSPSSALIQEIIRPHYRKQFNTIIAIYINYVCVLNELRRMQHSYMERTTHNITTLSTRKGTTILILLAFIK